MNRVMRRYIINITFLMILLLTPAIESSAQYRNGQAYSEINDSEIVTNLKSHVRYLSSVALEGRLAGSQGEIDAADYLSKMMIDNDIDMLSGEHGDVFGIKLDNGDTLTSRNVIAFIPGYDPSLREHYIVIGARMDNLGVSNIIIDGNTQQRIYTGANGNASGMAMLIELAKKLKTNQIMLRRSVLLIGFGASQHLAAGSWYFLNRAFPSVDNIDAMINLDMLGTGYSGFYAYTSSNPDMNEMVSSVNSTLQPVTPEITSEEPYPSDHRSFYDKKIPSVMLTTGRYPEHDTDKDTESIIDYDWMERELEYIYNYSIAQINGQKPIFDIKDEMRKHKDSSDNVVPYYDCDYRPTFLGSADPTRFLEQWVYHYLKYPQKAVEEGIQGKVLLEFVIDTKGNVGNVKVLRGVDPLLDDEAVRVVSASPAWKPGRVNGKKVNSKMSIYVEFRLERRGTKSFGIKK